MTTTCCTRLSRAALPLDCLLACLLAQPSRLRRGELRPSRLHPPLSHQTPLSPRSTRHHSPAPSSRAPPGSSHFWSTAARSPRSSLFLLPKRRTSARPRGPRRRRGRRFLRACGLNTTSMRLVWGLWGEEGGELDGRTFGFGEEEVDEEDVDGGGDDEDEVESAHASALTSRQGRAGGGVSWTHRHPISFNATGAATSVTSLAR